MEKTTNVLDMLLAIDPTKIKKPTKDVEIKRLSELTENKVVFTCESIDVNKAQKIYEDSVINGEYNSVANKIFTVIEGCKNPDLKDKKLLELYKVPNAYELLRSGKFLSIGEIQHLSDMISELSGFGEGAVEEIKNS